MYFSHFLALYYNKLARKKSLDQVVAKVKKYRPNTTDHDVYRKFQTLRTQYGQEVAKVRKSSAVEEEFAYQPKIWWWPKLQFLKHFVKCRNSNTISYILKSGKEEASEDETTEVLQMEEIHLEIPEPEKKKLRTDDSSNEEIYVSKSSLEDEGNKEKYIIYEESGVIDNDQQREIVVEPYPSTSRNTSAKRNEELGKFVATQMALIKDDVLFYKTQLEILTVVNKAQIRQLETSKKPRLTADEDDTIS